MHISAKFLIAIAVVIGLIELLHGATTHQVEFVPAVQTPRDAHAYPSMKTIQGTARVIDGDTVVVGITHVRLKGVDAPELSEPSGVAAMVAMQDIAGASLTCRLTGERTWGREVGWCFNSRGDDIGAAIIAAGKALACPYFDPRYVALEQPAAKAALPRAPYCRVRDRHRWQ